MTIDTNTLSKIVRDILTHVPHKPFMCLPLSALLYAELKDNQGLNPKLVTGDLLYKQHHIFKQDYSIVNEDSHPNQTWAGHAWVEIDNLICDLSIFRTLYSDEFTKPFKKELVDIFGEGKGCLLATKAQAHDIGLEYKAIDTLEDETAMGIINGFKYQLANG